MEREDRGVRRRVRVRVLVPMLQSVVRFCGPPAVVCLVVASARALFFFYPLKVCRGADVSHPEHPHTRLRQAVKKKYRGAAVFIAPTALSFEVPG